MNDDITVAVCHAGRWLFHATGRTPDEAHAALVEAWTAHADQTGADPGYLADCGINFITGPVGTGFRDWSPLPTLTTAGLT